jgi:hypothetical protein
MGKKNKMRGELSYATELQKINYCKVKRKQVEMFKFGLKISLQLS